MDGSGLLQMGVSYMQMGGNHDENVVEIIQIPDNSVGLVIGRYGTEIQNIQARSGCRVQMSGESEPGSNMRQCTLNGNGLSVDHAKQLINDVISIAGQRQQQQMQPPQHNFAYGGGDGMINTVDILIPANKCGLVIGKQGDTIKHLQETSGCKMVMIQDSQAVTGQAKPLRITGTPDKMEHAKLLVADLLSSRDDSGAPVPGGGMSRSFVTEQASAKGEVVVPHSSVGMIIGKGGETIKRLAMESGTRIQFKPDEVPNSSDRVAVIMGTHEQIYKATELITELVHRSMNGGSNGGGSAATNEIFFMRVPSNKAGLIIGKGGETIKQINSESGAHCQLSRDPLQNTQERVFIIKGTPYQIHHAQHIIRITVGDVPPGIPIPHFSGSGGQMAGFSGASHFNGQQMMTPQNQWSSNYGQQQDANGWNAQQTAQAYYAGGQVTAPAGNFAAAQRYQQPVAPQFAAPAVQQNPVPATQQLVQGTPVINPQTGQPDYSAQWAEYYRSMGMHDQATMIELQMNSRTGDPAAPSQSTAGYAATSAYPGAAGQPVGAHYAGYAVGQPPQFQQNNSNFLY